MGPRQITSTTCAPVAAARSKSSSATCPSSWACDPCAHARARRTGDLRTSPRGSRPRSARRSRATTRSAGGASTLSARECSAPSSLGGLLRLRHRAVGCRPRCRRGGACRALHPTESSGCVSCAYVTEAFRGPGRKHPAPAAASLIGAGRPRRVGGGLGRVSTIDLEPHAAACVTRGAPAGGDPVDDQQSETAVAGGARGGRARGLEARPVIAHLHPQASR
jgi:hypothetical protein